MNTIVSGLISGFTSALLTYVFFKNSIRCECVHKKKKNKVVKEKLEVGVAQSNEVEQQPAVLLANITAADNGIDI